MTTALTFAGPFEDGVAAYERGDHATAATSFKRAAQEGDAESQYTIGLLYLDGKGVPKDYPRAYLWFSMAATQDDQDAIKGRDIAAKLMTPRKIAEAQKMARECLASNYKKCD